MTFNHEQILEDSNRLFTKNIVELKFFYKFIITLLKLLFSIFYYQALKKAAG